MESTISLTSTRSEKGKKTVNIKQYKPKPHEKLFCGYCFGFFGGPDDEVRHTQQTMLHNGVLERYKGKITCKACKSPFHSYCAKLLKRYHRYEEDEFTCSECYSKISCKVKCTICKVSQGTKVTVKGLKPNNFAHPICLFYSNSYYIRLDDGFEFILIQERLRANMEKKAKKPKHKCKVCLQKINRCSAILSCKYFYPNYRCPQVAHLYCGLLQEAIVMERALQTKQTDYFDRQKLVLPILFEFDTEEGEDMNDLSYWAELLNNKRHMFPDPKKSISRKTINKTLLKQDFNEVTRKKQLDNTVLVFNMLCPAHNTHNFNYHFKTEPNNDGLIACEGCLNWFTYKGIEEEYRCLDQSLLSESGLAQYEKVNKGLPADYSQLEANDIKQNYRFHCLNCQTFSDFILNKREKKSLSTAKQFCIQHLFALTEYCLEEVIELEDKNNYLNLKYIDIHKKLYEIRSIANGSKKKAQSFEKIKKLAMSPSYQTVTEQDMTPNIDSSRGFVQDTIIDSSHQELNQSKKGMIEDIREFKEKSEEKNKEEVIRECKGKDKEEVIRECKGKDKEEDKEESKSIPIDSSVTSKFSRSNVEKSITVVSDPYTIKTESEGQYSNRPEPWRLKVVNSKKWYNRELVRYIRELNNTNLSQLISRIEQQIRGMKEVQSRKKSHSLKHDIKMYELINDHLNSFEKKPSSDENIKKLKALLYEYLDTSYDHNNDDILQELAHYLIVNFFENIERLDECEMVHLEKHDKLLRKYLNEVDSDQSLKIEHLMHQIDIKTPTQTYIDMINDEISTYLCPNSLIRLLRKRYKVDREFTIDFVNLDYDGLIKKFQEITNSSHFDFKMRERTKADLEKLLEMNRESRIWKSIESRFKQFCLIKKPKTLLYDHTDSGVLLMEGEMMELWKSEFFNILSKRHLQSFNFEQLEYHTTKLAEMEDKVNKASTGYKNQVKKIIKYVLRNKCAVSDSIVSLIDEFRENQKTKVYLRNSNKTFTISELEKAQKNKKNPIKMAKQENYRSLIMEPKLKEMNEIEKNLESFNDSKMVLSKNVYSMFAELKNKAKELKLESKYLRAIEKDMTFYYELNSCNTEESNVCVIDMLSDSEDENDEDLNEKIKKLTDVKVLEDLQLICPDDPFYDQIRVYKQTLDEQSKLIFPRIFKSGERVSMKKYYFREDIVNMLERLEIKEYEDFREDINSTYELYEKFLSDMFVEDNLIEHVESYCSRAHVILSSFDKYRVDEEWFNTKLREFNDAMKFIIMVHNMKQIRDITITRQAQLDYLENPKYFERIYETVDMFIRYKAYRDEYEDFFFKYKEAWKKLMSMSGKMKLLKNKFVLIKDNLMPESGPISRHTIDELLYCTEDFHFLDPVTVRKVKELRDKQDEEVNSIQRLINDKRNQPFGAADNDEDIKKNIIEKERVFFSSTIEDSVDFLTNLFELVYRQDMRYEKIVEISKRLWQYDQKYKFEGDTKTLLKDLDMIKDNTKAYMRKWTNLIEWRKEDEDFLISFNEVKRLIYDNILKVKFGKYYCFAALVKEVNIVDALLKGDFKPLFSHDCFETCIKIHLPSKLKEAVDEKLLFIKDFNEWYDKKGKLNPHILYEIIQEVTHGEVKPFFYLVSDDFKKINKNRLTFKTVFNSLIDVVQEILKLLGPPPQKDQEEAIKARNEAFVNACNLSPDMGCTEDEFKILEVLIWFYRVFDTVWKGGMNCGRQIPDLFTKDNFGSVSLFMEKPNQDTSVRFFDELKGFLFDFVDSILDKSGLNRKIRNPIIGQLNSELQRRYDPLKEFPNLNSPGDFGYNSEQNNFFILLPASIESSKEIVEAAKAYSESLMKKRVKGIISSLLNKHKIVLAETNEVSVDYMSRMLDKFVFKTADHRELIKINYFCEELVKAEPIFSKPSQIEDKKVFLWKIIKKMLEEEQLKDVLSGDRNALNKLLREVNKEEDIVPKKETIIGAYGKTADDLKIIKREERIQRELDRFMFKGKQMYVNSYDTIKVEDYCSTSVHQINFERISFAGEEFALSFRTQYRSYQFSFADSLDLNLSLNQRVSLNHELPRVMDVFEKRDDNQYRTYLFGGILNQKGLPDCQGKTILNSLADQTAFFESFKNDSIHLLIAKYKDIDQSLKEILNYNFTLEYLEYDFKKLLVFFFFKDPYIIKPNRFGFMAEYELSNTKKREDRYESIDLMKSKANSATKDLNFFNKSFFKNKDVFKVKGDVNLMEEQEKRDFRRR